MPPPQSGQLFISVLLSTFGGQNNLRCRRTRCQVNQFNWLVHHLNGLHCIVQWSESMEEQKTVLIDRWKAHPLVTYDYGTALCGRIRKSVAMLVEQALNHRLEPWTRLLVFALSFLVNRQTLMIVVVVGLQIE